MQSLSPPSFNTNHAPIQRQDPSAESAVHSLFQKAMRPLFTLCFGAMNKFYTDQFLTSSNILPKEMIHNISGVSLESIKEDIEALSPNSHMAIHLGCLGEYVSHSTALVIGKDNEGEAYALFFDPQGKEPKKALLMENSIQVEENKNQFETIENAEVLFQKIAQRLKKPLSLKFTSAYTQYDWNTCTAHTAAFLEELKKAEEGGFNSKDFMEQLANGQLITLSKVFNQLFKLYHQEKDESTISSVQTPPNTSSNLIQSFNSDFDLIPEITAFDKMDPLPTDEKPQENSSESKEMPKSKSFFENYYFSKIKFSNLFETFKSFLKYFF